MNIYTSCFGRLPEFPDSLVPIAICLETPPEYTGLRILELAPSHDILYEYLADRNTDRYVRRFTAEILSGLQASDVLAHITDLSQGRDCVLLCYEAPNEFCHRHLAAQWLNASLGLSITEWDA